MAKKLFEKFIKENNLDIKPVKLEVPTTTAQQAASAHNVPVSNIVKSLVVRADNEFFMVLCPGDKKIDFQKLKSLLNKKNIRMANAQEVKEITGHSIGGVPPFGHKQPIKTIILPGFSPNKPLWAAAGRSDANFKISLLKLKNTLKQQNLLFKVRH